MKRKYSDKAILKNTYGCLGEEIHAWVYLYRKDLALDIRELRLIIRNNGDLKSINKWVTFYNKDKAALQKEIARANEIDRTR